MIISNHRVLRWAEKHYPLLDANLVAEIYLSGFNSGYAEGTLNQQTCVREHDAPNEQMVEQIRKDYISGGLSLKELAVRYKRTIYAIQTILRRNNIRKNIRWGQTEITYLLEHFGKDLTTKELAEHFRISPDAVISNYKRFTSK